MLKVQDVCDLIQKFAPFETAEEWDNVGLVVGRKNTELRKVLLCVDVTSEVIAEARGLECQLIVSHHPVIFKALNKVNDDGWKGSQILDLIENKIAVIAAHTNADAAQGGLNDLMAQRLGLKSVTAERYLRIGNIDGGMTSEEFVKLIKERIGISQVTISGQLPDLIQRVGVFTGSVDEEEIIAKRETFDIVVVGEFNHHKGLDLIEEGVCAVMCSHYSSELIFTAWMKELLREGLPQLEVICSKVGKNPFTIV